MSWDICVDLTRPDGREIHYTCKGKTSWLSGMIDLEIVYGLIQNMLTDIQKQHVVRFFGAVLLWFTSN